MISSEPYAIAAFSVVLAVLIDRQPTWLDLVVLVATGAAHAASVPLIALMLLLAVLLSFRPRLRDLVLLVAAVGSSIVIDRLVYHSFGPNLERLAMGYVGAQILSLYPFALDAKCAEEPAFKLCREPYRSHIANSLARKGTGVGQQANCGRGSAAVLLWGRSTLLSRWGTSTLAPEAQLGHAELNQLSSDIAGTFLTTLPAHLPQVTMTTLCRLRFGLAGKGWRPWPPAWIPQAGDPWIERPGFLPRRPM